MAADLPGLRDVSRDALHAAALLHDAHPGGSASAPRRGGHRGSLYRVVPSRRLGHHVAGGWLVAGGQGGWSWVVGSLSKRDGL